jgi:type IV pilus assembly protein PilC
VITYNYEARNTATGQKIKAQVQADNERAAAKLIQEQGLAPLEITPEKATNVTFANKIKTKDKVLFARQLSTMVNAGLPLVQSLRTVQGQTTSKPLKNIVSEIISNVEGGKSLSESLKRHPEAFNNVFVSMVAAGEASGTLDSSLERLANQQEKDAEIMSKIRGAMIYPLVVILVMVAVVGFMVVYVLPQVKTLYEGMGGAAQLPFVTKVLLGLSDFVIKFWWLLLVIAVAIVVFGTRWAKSLGGKQVLDRLKLNLAPINRLYKKMYMARFTRTGSTLVAAGVPLIQVLEITAAAISNVLLEKSIERAITKVKGGKPLSDALQNDPYFPELVPNMLRIGEQSGSLESMMAKTADYYDKELDNEIKNISAIIEPALMVLLGAAALVIVAAVLLPIYGLAGKTIIK